MDIRIIKPISIITAVILITAVFGMLIGSLETYALTVIGEDYGLSVHLSDDHVPTSNLNPGDTKTSFMTINNTGDTSSSLPVYLKADIIHRELGLGGADLDDKLELTIQNPNDDILFRGFISELDSYIEVGNVDSGSPLQLSFSVHLPGSADNDYQGSSLSVKWTVMTQLTPGETETPQPSNTPPPEGTQPPGETPPPSETPTPGPTPTPDGTASPGPTPTGDTGDIDDEEIDIDDGGIPAGEADNDITIDDDVVPGGGLLPKTGETAPVFFYAAGIILIGIGLLLRYRRRKVH